MIKSGSRVNIYWERVQAEFNVVVASVPNNPDSPWIFRRDDGKEVIVSSFSKIEEVDQGYNTDIKG